MVGCCGQGPLRHRAMAEQDLMPSNGGEGVGGGSRVIRHSNGYLLRAVLFLLCYRNIKSS